VPASFIMRRASFRRIIGSAADPILKASSHLMKLRTTVYLRMHI
jgi:hypothetical protein